MLLGVIIKNSTGMYADELAEKHLFTPLGISDYSWRKSLGGSVITAWGLSLKPRDMAKIGYLFLKNGRRDIMRQFVFWTGVYNILLGQCIRNLAHDLIGYQIGHMRIHAYRRLALLLFGFFHVCLLISCEKPPPYKAIPATVTKASGETELAEVLNSIRLEERLPGLAAAVIVDGKLFSAAAVGVREIGTKNWLTVNDKFLIGSCAKAFTATTAAILVEEGRLDWQTTIGDAFPDMEMLPEYENITLVQLLSHRAGLPKNLKEGKASWLIDYGFDEKRGSSPENLRLQYVEKTLQSQLIEPPGKVWHYSNSGYILAGSILEKVTGQTYESLREEKIFQPLGITTAGYGIPADTEPMTQPWGHVWDLSSSFIVYKSEYPNFMAPTGCLNLSIEDWAKFILLHLGTYPKGNHILLKENTLKKLHTPPDGPVSDNYALGWFTKINEEGQLIIFHGGRGLCFNALVTADLNSKNALLLVTNTEVGHIHPQRQIIKMRNKLKEYYSDRFKLP
jgi:CubicO group peptidase (beta-lactamase class C family)